MLTLPLHGYQEPPVDQFLGRGSLLVTFAMGLGKAQPYSEPVLTPDGFVPMGDIKPGHWVIGSDGQPTKVLGVYPQGERRVFEVSFSDGTAVKVTEDHLWRVKNQSGVWSTQTTGDLLSEGLTQRTNGNRKWQIPMVQPVYFWPADAPTIDPYLLGLLLGDGSMTDGCVGFSTADPEIVEAVRAVIPSGLIVSHKAAHDYRITTGGRGGTRVNVLTNALRWLGLWGCKSYTKFVPGDYLRGSIEARLAVLQGLMDTDGTPVAGGGAEFNTVSAQLLHDVVYLAQSLGGTARVGKPRQTSYTHNGEIRKGVLSYRVNIKLPASMEPFRLTRKLEKWQRPTKYPPARMITGIRDLGYDEACQCIKVAAQDHLYVTWNFVVTHNTPIGIACAEELLGCEDIGLCLIVCESSLKYQWAQELAKFTDIPSRKIRLTIDGQKQEITIPAEPYCVIVDGKPFQRNKVKFSAADDRKRQYKHSVSTKTDYVIVSYDNLVDDARWVRQLHPGLVILDEATAIKTFSAERTQKIKRIMDAPYRLALTGTPVDNKAEELFSIMEWVDPDVLGRWDLFEAAYIVRNDYGRVIRYKNLHVLRERLGPAIARVSHDDPKVQGFIPKTVVRELPVEADDNLYAAFTDIAADLLEGLRSIKKRGGFDLAAYYAGQPDENTAAGLVMAMLTAMDMLLAHPDLLVMSAEQYAESARLRELGVEKKTWPGSKYAWEKWQAGLVDDLWGSAKLDRLAERVPEILAEDPAFKVMVYTRWPAALEYMRDAIGVPCVLYHGGLSPKAKAAAQAKFTNDPATRLFLSSHAGARGVNLYKGSHLINYDLPWAAGLADQINGRHVRASSAFKQVWVENMVTEGTTECWKRDNLMFKRRVGSAILDGRGANRFGEVENEAQSLTAFLTAIVEGA